MIDLIYIYILICLCYKISVIQLILFHIYNMSFYILLDTFLQTRHQTFLHPYMSGCASMLVLMSRHGGADHAQTLLLSTQVKAPSMLSK